METNLPTTLIEAIEFYADPMNCEKTMISIRFPNGICCPRCGDLAVTKLSRPCVWKCNGCKRQFTMKVGTIFEDSALPLSKWLTAIWLLAGAKNGISSCELARALGVTQKTSWFMLHRIRHAMNSGSFDKMSGTIEVDETYVGGLNKNKHVDKKLKNIRGWAGKSVVGAVLERSIDGKKVSRVRTKIIENTDRKTMHGLVSAHVEDGSQVFTDAHSGYNTLSPQFAHEFVDHAVRYVRGSVHTNSLENYFSLLKRMVRGTYVAIEPYHLMKYCDELSFRFNERKNSDQERFVKVLQMISGKRLTYGELTGSYEEYFQQAYS